MDYECGAQCVALVPLGAVPNMQWSCWRVSKSGFALFLTKRYLMAPSRPEGALTQLQIARLIVSHRGLRMMQIAVAFVHVLRPFCAEARGGRN